MPYIGNTVQNQGFAPAIDYFSGNGVTVTFTLSRNIASVAQVICAIDNVIQNPSSAFTVSGNSITFTSAPLSGTNNIWVEYTSLITTYAAISQDPSVIGDITASGGYLSAGDFGNSYVDGTILDYVTGNGRITVGDLDGLTIYNGGTAARSSLLSVNASGAVGVGTSPSYGTAGQYLVSQGAGAAPQWTTLTIPAAAVNYLVIAGGGSGGGGTYNSGGGGAGGYLTGATAVTAGTTYTITVGAGGSGTTGYGANGSASSALGISTVGGGGGGQHPGGSSSNGASGGSGGGASQAGYSGGSGTSGQGNAGGGNWYAAGAGGGGAGAAAQTGPGGSTVGTQARLSGGIGLQSSIDGTATYRGGGGGGGQRTDYSIPQGLGGTGGGGNGGLNTGNGFPGTANTGGGGGGSGGIDTNLRAGGSGGSGVVIISYSVSYAAATATGTYTLTSVGGNRIYTFTGSGTIIF